MLIFSYITWFSVFPKTLKYLKKEGYIVELMPYDWRACFEDTAKEVLMPVLELLKEKYNVGKINVVAHSMGGLITRTYIQSTEYRNDIDKFVMIGTPNMGSAEMYFLIHGGDLNYKKENKLLIKGLEEINELNIQVGITQFLRWYAKEHNLHDFPLNYQSTMKDGFYEITIDSYQLPAEELKRYLCFENFKSFEIYTSIEQIYPVLLIKYKVELPQRYIKEYLEKYLCSASDLLAEYEFLGDASSYRSITEGYLKELNSKKLLAEWEKNVGFAFGKTKAMLILSDNGKGDTLAFIKTNQKGNELYPEGIPLTNGLVFENGDQSTLATLKYCPLLESVFKNTVRIPEIKDYGDHLKLFKQKEIQQHVVDFLDTINCFAFNMGDSLNQGGKYEKPVHKTTFYYHFEIGKTEITFDDYIVFCKETGRDVPNDNGWGKGKRPVINVNWYDCIAYCNWLSKVAGLPLAYDEHGNLVDSIDKVHGYRLPTEAEWEYAARGGLYDLNTLYSGGNDINSLGWYWQNSGEIQLSCSESDWNWSKVLDNNSKTHEVGKKEANILGLYDMTGNVMEWCYDWFGKYELKEFINPEGMPTRSNYKVLRGGGWAYAATLCRVSNRSFGEPEMRSATNGFRIARTIIK